jgi:hypothetical protein
VIGVELDSTETIACSGAEVRLIELTTIYADCFDLSSIIGSISFEYISREANKK